MKLLVSVFKSPKKEDMYLYVQKSEQMKKVPEGLEKLLGKPQHVMDFLLTPQRQLARVETDVLMQALQEKGYYLQMPAPEDEYIEHLPEELLTRNDAL